MIIVMRSSMWFLTILLVAASTAQAERATLSEAMARYLACYPVELVVRNKQLPVISRREVCLSAVYNENGNQPLWVTENGPTTKAEVIWKFLQKAEDEGLDPGDYQVDEIEALWEETTLSALARLDTLITFNAVKYVHDVSHGQIEPYLANPELFEEAGKPDFDPLLLVEVLQNTDDLDRYFEQLPPQNLHYQDLKQGLTMYRELNTDTGWEPIARGKTLRQGDSDPRIPLIRARLAKLAGEISDEHFSEIYDEDLVLAIMRFQELHGLKRDGIIGKNTMAALNTTPAERLEQIKINMARWRWQDDDFDNEYVLVNIADFYLYIYKEEELQLLMPVIVGKFQHQTPVFSDRIKYLEFNPFWNVPTSIAVEEDLPKLRENPNYLVSKNIRLFSSWREDAVELDSTIIDWPLITKSEMAGYRLRQDPGPSNALGQLKFVFPNHHSIYLHDTPAKNLFEEDTRSFSHGCIRVSDPAGLALYMLQRQEENWDREAVRELIDAGERKVVLLKPSLPIHITYQTAWVDKTGEIHFNTDIYGRDELLKQALFNNEH